MIDHVSLRVSDVPRARALYAAALAPLGYEVVMEMPQFGTVAFGPRGKPVVWLTQAQRIVPTHLALVARDREAVGKFYAAALAAGARDNGPPGLREHYHPGYYGAFVLDHDGNNLEAVVHERPAG
jgi:catechol 2,3-dioxygenase-like lactoylglutathione lyase family enzyme